MPGLSALDPQARSVIVQGVASGVPLDTVARLAGIGVSTLREWLRLAETGQTTWLNGSGMSDAARQELAAFSDEIARAAAEYERKALDEIAEYGADDGKKRRDWRSRAWMLEHHPLYKQRWSEQRDLHVDQQVTVTELRQQLVSLNAEDLVALTPDRYRDLLDQPGPDPDQEDQPDPDQDSQSSTDSPPR